MPFNDNLPAEETDPWYTPLVTAWNNLKTFVNGLETTLGTKASSSDLSSGLATKVNTSTFTSQMANKADLVGGLIPTNQLPPLAVTETFTAASQAAMLALTAQPGDIAIRTDSSQSFILAAAPASTLANWKEIVALGGVIAVAGRQGVVTLNKNDVLLSNVDNTSDANKPISILQAQALATKASTTDLDNVFGIATDAQATADAAVPQADVAGLNDVGWGRAVFIANGGTPPVGTPAYTLVIEASA